MRILRSSGCARKEYARSDGLVLARPTRARNRRSRLHRLAPRRSPGAWPRSRVRALQLAQRLRLARGPRAGARRARGDLPRSCLRLSAGSSTRRTSEVYGRAEHPGPGDASPAAAITPCGVEGGADQMAPSYFAPFDLPVVTARPFNTYGPRQSAREHPDDHQLGAFAQRRDRARIARHDAGLPLGRRHRRRDAEARRGRGACSVARCRSWPAPSGPSHPGDEEFPPSPSRGCRSSPCIRRQRGAATPPCGKAPTRGRSVPSSRAARAQARFTVLVDPNAIDLRQGLARSGLWFPAPRPQRSLRKSRNGKSEGWLPATRPAGVSTRRNGPSE
jgi:hypothetical protein